MITNFKCKDLIYFGHLSLMLLHSMHSGKHRATTLMIVALGNWNPHLVENVEQVAGADSFKVWARQVYLSIGRDGFKKEKS